MEFDPAKNRNHAVMQRAMALLKENGVDVKPATNVYGLVIDGETFEHTNVSAQVGSMYPVEWKRITREIEENPDLH